MKAIFKLTKSNLLRLIDGVALICCVIHIAYNVNDIIKGENRTRLKISTEKEIALPKIYLCFYISRILNYTYFSLKYPDISVDKAELVYDKFHNSTLFQTLSKLRVQELKEILKDPRRIIESIHPAPSIDNIYETQVSSDDCKLSYNLIETQLCLQIVCRKNGSVINYNRSVVSYGESDGQLLMIKFTQRLREFATSFAIILVPSDEMIYLKSEIPLYHDYHNTSSPFKLVFAFQVLRTSYSKNDFFTECKNYSQDGYLNKMDKIMKCLNNKTLDWIGAPYHSAIQPINNSTLTSRTVLYQSYLEYLSPDIERRKFYQAQFRSFREECSPPDMLPDCEDMTLRPIGKEIVYGQTNQSIIIIKITAQPTSSNIIVPYYNLDDLIVYTQCVIGIWLGISPTMIIDWVIDRIADKFFSDPDKSSDRSIKGHNFGNITANTVSSVVEREIRRHPLSNSMQDSLSAGPTSKQFGNLVSLKVKPKEKLRKQHILSRVNAFTKKSNQSNNDLFTLPSLNREKLL